MAPQRRGRLRELGASAVQLSIQATDKLVYQDRFQSCGIASSQQLGDKALRLNEPSAYHQD